MRQCKNYIYIIRLVLLWLMKHGFGIKSLLLFIYGQTFCGRTWTLNVSKTLIMNAKLKFDQFSLVISNNKNPFLHEHDSTNQQKLWNWKRKVSVSNPFSIWIKKADLWNTVHNIPRSCLTSGSTLHPVTHAIFGIPFIWKHKTPKLLKRLWVSSQSVFTEVVDCLVHFNCIWGHSMFSCCIFGQDWCCRCI